MTELLLALNWKPNRMSWIGFLAVIGATTVLVLLSSMTVERLCHVPPIAMQGAMWGLWLVWLGALFPRNRLRDSQRPLPHPYRRAFQREILLGIAIAFSQIARPAAIGVLAEPELPAGISLAAGLPVLLLGVAITCSGVAALGIARTLFVYEYTPTDEPLTIDGIFQFLRHPLFLGGSIVSLGSAICTGAPIAVELGLVNVCVIPLYVRLEDRRCCLAIGDEYAAYRAAVGGVIPRRRSAIIRSARAHQFAGSSDPSVPRNRVVSS